MSTIPEKMAKQFEYQQTLFATSADPMDLFVSVDRLATYLASQMRADPRRVRAQVKAELERMADAGEARRWKEVYGRPSLRPHRVDHYFLPNKNSTEP